MLDNQSRKILRYIKKHKRASFNEIIEHFPNQGLTVHTLVSLNMNQYTICVGNENCGRKQAVYELQAKGYGELEDHRKQMIIRISPIIISFFSFAISVLALVMPY